MQQDVPFVQPLQPPADLPDIQRGDWFPLSMTDPLIEYITANVWDRPDQPAAWQAARLSHAAYVYRETTSAWNIVAKFYAVKTGAMADKYAGRELEVTQEARAAGLSAGNVRAIRPLGLWRGVLLLEYVDGLTLEDVIAVRRNRPGTVNPALERAATLLATLHTHGVRPAARPDFAPAVAYAHEIVDDLAQHGVLQNEPIVRDGLRRLIDGWAGKPAMQDFTPAYNHGDATTSNFVFPGDGGVVAIDWERFEITDPAADLGRLMAEVSHSIKQHGGSAAEAEPFVQRLVEAYCGVVPADWDTEALVRRATFYRAQSTLRIARNGWVSRLDRTALVAQAAVLLS